MHRWRNSPAILELSLATEHGVGGLPHDDEHQQIISEPLFVARPRPWWTPNGSSADRDHKSIEFAVRDIGKPLVLLRADLVFAAHWRVNSNRRRRA